MELLHIKGSDKIRIKQFDVVELNNKKKAIIKKICKRKNYLTEVINDDKTKIEHKVITDKDISKVIYSRKKDKKIGTS